MSGTAEIAAAAAFVDAVADEMGEGRLSPVVEKEAGAAVARVAALIGPAVGAVLAKYLQHVQLQDVALDGDRPFSDESLSNALSQVLGVPVRSIKDREALREAFKAAVNKEVSATVGYPFENIFDKSLLRRDVLRAIGVNSSRLVPGLELNDLSDRAQTRRDVEEYARKMVSHYTGIEFSDLRSKDAIKEDIYIAVEPYFRELFTGEMQESKSKRPVKMDRKSIRNREAQRRFRKAHGRLESYVGLKARQENAGG